MWQDGTATREVKEPGHSIERHGNNTEMRRLVKLIKFGKVLTKRMMREQEETRKNKNNILNRERQACMASLVE